MKRTYTLWNVPQSLGVATCFVGTAMVFSLPAYIAIYSGAGWVPFYAGLTFVALPIIYVQVKLGGAAHKNAIGTINKFVPFLKGVGLVGLIRSFILSVVTGVLASYCFIYAFESLKTPYKWGNCNNVWNTDKCDPNRSWQKNEGIPSTAEYFENGFLAISSGVSKEGAILWLQAAVLAAIWGTTFFTVVFGMGIFATFMAIFGGVAIVLSISMVAYGREEVNHMKPEGIFYGASWSKITEPSIMDAVLGPWMLGMMQGLVLTKAWDGVLPTIGKYCGRTATRINFSWLYIFLGLSILPHLVLNMLLPYLGASGGLQDLPLQRIITDSPQTLFVHLASAVHLLNLKRGIAFTLYLTIGIFLLQSQCLWTAVVVDSTVDGTRHLKCCGRKAVRLVATSVVYCCICYIASLPLITQGGYYLLLLLIHWVDKMLFVLIFFSLIAFLVSFAKAPFHTCNKLVMGTWFTLASLLAAVAYGYKFWQHHQENETELKVKVGQVYTYPGWAYIVGWLVAVIPILIGLLFGLMHAVGSASGSGRKRCNALCCGNTILTKDKEKTYSTNISYIS